jgi:hypothetical protein
VFGKILQVPLTKKQQRSITVNNFIQYLHEMYDGFSVSRNPLIEFYPKLVRKQIMKQKNGNPDRIAATIRKPVFKTNEQQAHSDGEPSANSKFVKRQQRMMEVTLQKIQRKTRPIKNEIRVIEKSLAR